MGNFYLMQFSLQQSLPILERTPSVLRSLLSGLSDDWTTQNEGGETWSPYDVLGHLIHGEKTDWLVRINKCLSVDDKEFVRFDRFAQFHESKGKSLSQLLDEFEHIRTQNLQLIKQMDLQEEDLDKIGIHPEFGEVTLRQLLATWTTHDLTHIVQIARTMAKQYKDAIGPWAAYFSVMQ